VRVVVTVVALAGRVVVKFSVVVIVVVIRAPVQLGVIEVPVIVEILLDDEFVIVLFEEELDGEPVEGLGEEVMPNPVLEDLVFDEVFTVGVVLAVI